MILSADINILSDANYLHLIVLKSHFFNSGPSPNTKLFSSNTVTNELSPFSNPAHCTNRRDLKSQMFTLLNNPTAATTSLFKGTLHQHESAFLKKAKGLALIKSVATVMPSCPHEMSVVSIVLNL
jgi:hypothetical protein